MRVDFLLVGLVVGLLLGVHVGRWATEEVALVHACGECDHVGECGDYECRPGVDGWQMKAGAR